MGTRWVDVSMPMQPCMTAWPDDAPFELSPSLRIARGAPYNASRLTMSTHAGTHVDAPWHFEEDGFPLEDSDPALFFGDALVMDITECETVTAAALGPGPLPPRLLFKTRNSALTPDAPFTEDYAAVEADAAKRLVDEGVRLVGIDYLSIAPYDQQDDKTHHILLQNNVVIVEGLCLAEVEAGTHSFVVLPLPVLGADGAPCRAFVGVLEEEP